MEMNWKTKSSFLFGGTDMYQAFGISISDNGLPQDALLPELRPRKVTIPLRSGTFDFGAHYYNERSISIGCVTVRAGTRDDAREMAYVLSKKSEIYFWNEPDKYYVGRVYQAPSLEVLRNIGNRFTLTFVCEPFAYGKTVTEQMPALIYQTEYPGTAPTPTLIEIRNVGTTNAVNIQIVQTNRKENL